MDFVQFWVVFGQCLVTSRQVLGEWRTGVNKNFKKNVLGMKFGPACRHFRHKNLAFHPHFASA